MDQVDVVAVEGHVEHLPRVDRGIGRLLGDGDGFGSRLPAQVGCRNADGVRPVRYVIVYHFFDNTAVVGEIFETGDLRTVEGHGYALDLDVVHRLEADGDRGDRLEHLNDVTVQGGGQAYLGSGLVGTGLEGGDGVDTVALAAEGGEEQQSGKKFGGKVHDRRLGAAVRRLNYPGSAVGRPGSGDRGGRYPRGR